MKILHEKNKKKTQKRKQQLGLEKKVPQQETSKLKSESMDQFIV